jgi:hypothetical protein
MGSQDLSMEALCSVHTVPLKASFCRTFPFLMHKSLPIKVDFFSLGDIHIKIK